MFVFTILEPDQYWVFEADTKTDNYTVHELNTNISMLTRLANIFNMFTTLV